MYDEGIDVFELRAMIAALMPEDNALAPSHELVDLLEGALELYPESATLYCILGDLIQLGLRTNVCKGIARECYLKAIKLDPLCTEAYESLGYLSFTMEVDDAGAWFGKAIDVGAGTSALVGLAKVRAEGGDFAAATDAIVQAKAICDNEWKKVRECEDLIHQRELDDGKGTLGVHPDEP
jgi:hypothetical protein